MRLYTDSFYYHCAIHQSKPGLPYLLMLHGFMGSGKVFEHLIDGLTSFCNPITIDLAGHGETESPADPMLYSAERQVKQIHSIIQRLQFDNLFLYGYSMGGRLAFQLIASYSNLFSGAIIESSHCGTSSKMEKTNRKNLDDERARQIEHDFDEFIDDWMKLPLFQHTPDQIKTVYQDVMKDQNPKTISGSIRGFGAGVMPSVCSKITQVDLPLTLIVGELDQKYVNRMSEIQKSNDRSDFHIIKGAGHRVHTDQPEKFVEILKETLNT